MANQALYWWIAALVAIGIFAHLWTGRIRLYMAPKEWQLVERDKDEGRFWFFVVVEFLLLLILIWQALDL